ncbi:MAG: NAD(P)/FAD-dependent oxidoreductase [Polyangiales bacterium]
MEATSQALARTEPHKPHVVVLGAGFAGLQLVNALRRAPVRITVIDRHNYHLFQPLLYQVATAALEPADIAGPIRQIIRNKNTEVLLSDVLAVEPDMKRVRLPDRTIDYDYLVVATGSTHSYFGHDEWGNHAPGLKTLDDAVEIRRRVLYAFEAAERCTDPVEQREWLTFVVVGAGPTGVELAGALAEIARGTRAREYHNIDPATARILLIEGLPRVLTAYTEELSEKAKRALERKGVTLQLNTKVTDVMETAVQTDQERIPTRTVLWAAGVAASPLARSLNTDLDRAGRVVVGPDLTVKGHKDVFVVGDLASVTIDNQTLPGLAPVAMAQGKHTGRNILRLLAGEPTQPFSYYDRGSFAVIGRGAAVGVAFKRFHVAGYFAWLAWLAIHIAFLVGFRNRIAVMFNWAYVYFTRRRHAQIIVGEGPNRETSRAPALPNPEPRQERDSDAQPIAVGSQQRRAAG